LRLLFIFLDGVGLGNDDPQINPFARIEMPTLERLLGGRKLIAREAPVETEWATLLALDARLETQGLPQSATGQASLLTGFNVPAEIGYHYGPKPNPEVAQYLKKGNLFQRVLKSGRQAALLNAYPPGYFEAIRSGRRLYSAIPLAVTSAGIDLKTSQDYFAGRALSADLTGQGWREHLGYQDAPVLSPQEAGLRLGRLAAGLDLAFFEHWLTDYAGHRRDMHTAAELLRDLDGLLAGLLETWQPGEGLILITSDHGNLEDLSTRRHTANPVPAIVIGAEKVRRRFACELRDLSDVTPAILSFLNGSNSTRASQRDQSNT
jgi:2,3-bisphosphoglycerate-independent phosphoglycerate mutase